jgi:hypothetical protein
MFKRCFSLFHSPLTLRHCMNFFSFVVTFLLCAFVRRLIHQQPCPFPPASSQETMSLLRQWILRWDECRRSVQPVEYQNLWDNYNTRPLPLRTHATQWALVTFLLLCIAPLIFRPLLGVSNNTVAMASFIWLSIWNISFVYVSGVLSRRHQPFRGRHQGYHDIIAINIYAVVMIHHLQLPQLYQTLIDTYDTHSIWLLYLVAMFVLFMVLHLSLLTNVILPSIASFSLTASRLKILPRWLALPLLSLIGIIIAAIGYAIIITNTLRFYTLMYTTIVVAIVAMTWLLSDQFHLWFHHWAVAALLLPLMAPILSLVFHLHNDAHSHSHTSGSDGRDGRSDEYGMMARMSAFTITAALSSFLIEGAARWSLAPLWHVRGA